jgi:uroporphyrinogen-III synthase
MKEPIHIVSTKKLSQDQKQHLLTPNFFYEEEDFIKIKNSSFTINTIGEYLIITSQNAVESILLNPKKTELKKHKCFCVGIKTKALLEQNGFEVVVYSDYAAELASIICNQYQKSSFTFFSGNLRRDILPEAMLLAQINFEEIVIYETILQSHKINKKPEGILFFSPSGVESYLQQNTITTETCFCIGKTTAEALETTNTVITNQPTIENTVTQCINYYNK